MANDPRFEVYPRREEVRVHEGAQDPAAAEDIGGKLTGEFGWRFRAANGQISAIGGEGFTRREDAHRAVGDFVVDVRKAAYGLRYPEAVAEAAIDVDD
jgi:hypothetical protein